VAEQLRAGIVGGAGIMGRRHAVELNDNPYTKLVALSDLDLEKAQQAATEAGCKGYSSTEEMLEKENLDVVYVATPDHTHKKPLMTVLSAGIKNILLQKPFATSVEDGEAMYEAIQKAKATVFVTYGTRSSPENAAGRYMIESGLLGESTYASMRNVDNISVPRKMWSDRKDNWVASSSSVPFLYSHRIDRLRWFYQPAEVAVVNAVSQRKVLDYSVDFFESFLTWTNGIVTRVHTGWVDFGSQLVYVDNMFYGTKGMITHNELPAFGRPTSGWQVMFDDDMEMSTLQKAQEELLDRGIQTRIIWERLHDRYLPELAAGLELIPGGKFKSVTDYMIDAVVEGTLCPKSWEKFQGKAPLPTAIDGLEQTRVCCAVEQASATGQPVKLR
jgi:predicted dehydrogenase